MKNTVKRALSVLSALALIIASIVLYPTDSFASEEKLYAARLGLDNGKVSGISTELTYTVGDVNDDGRINGADMLYIKMAIAGKLTFSQRQSRITDIDCNDRLNGIDMYYIKKLTVGQTFNLPYVCAGNASLSYNSSAACATVKGDSGFSVRIDFSSLDMDVNRITHIVVNSGYTDFSAVPVMKDAETGAVVNTAVKTVYNGKAYFSLPGADTNEYTGVILTCPEAGQVNISEVFACANEYSAKWIIDNRINPSKGTAKNLSVNIESENLVLRLGQMTDDDKTNSNGGMYHDFVNTKWPSIAVDENDKLYISASGCRMAHVDPFGATVLVTSEDGGKTFSKPRQISNTIMDDRDAGIAYLGDGKLLVTYFTNSAESYLPGGSNYNVLKLNSSGGSSPSWQAASWDSSGNPVGGINGTYISMVRFIKNTDPSYCTDYASYVIKSTDYGESWSAESYSYVTQTRTTQSMRDMLSNYRITKPGTRVPVTSAHGPLKLSDGTVLYAGKVLDAADQPIDTMAVYISRDDGDTWEYRSEIERPTGFGVNNFHELSVTETADGALLCAIRTQPSETGNMNVSPLYTVYTCFSYDGGRTWTVPAPTGIDGTPPQVITMQNGDIVMTTGHRSDPRYIYANVSTDGGRTWSDSALASSKFVNGDDMGYPANAVLSDGTVVTVYYGSYRYGSYADQYSSILASRWNYSLD